MKRCPNCHKLMADHDLGDAGECWGEMFFDDNEYQTEPKFLVVKNTKYEE